MFESAECPAERMPNSSNKTSHGLESGQHAESSCRVTIGSWIVQECGIEIGTVFVPGAIALQEYASIRIIKAGPHIAQAGFIIEKLAMKEQGQPNGASGANHRAGIRQVGAGKKHGTRCRIESERDDLAGIRVAHLIHQRSRAQ